MGVICFYCCVLGKFTELTALWTWLFKISVLCSFVIGLCGQKLRKSNG